VISLDGQLKPLTAGDASKSVLNEIFGPRGVTANIGELAVAGEVSERALCEDLLDLPDEIVALVRMLNPNSLSETLAFGTHARTSPNR
jgi:hypothetical protein